MSLFVGLKISGIWGAVLGPMALMLAISIFKSGLFDNTIADFKAVADDVSGIFS
jgi:predicted PurR-regulated permease PerM